MAPPLVTRLPKVTEYVRNVGKSVQYATVDYFKGSMSETSDFIENNQELFKDIAAAVKDYKGTLKAADRSIRQSKIYEAGSELKKTLFDSIRTGKFYDPEREAYYQSKASGSLGDMSDMDDWGFDTDQFDINSGDMSQEDSTNLLSSTVKDATTAQANVIAKSSEYLAEMNKANTRLLFAQGEKMYATVNAGLASTQSMLDRVNKFLEGPLTTHMENSKTFYEQTNKILNEMNANLKELTEMQRNLYKREQKMAEESQFSKVGASPDLKEYSKQLYKNFMDILGPEAQMVLGNDMGEGSNMLMALVANPLQGIPNFIVKSIVPVTIKKSLETLDASFSNLFANFIARMNKAAGSDNIILQYLGRLFGLKLDKKTTYDSSKYEKGPVPFDGITRKTIVDIIPGHLARIEAALTGKTERVFDYETGKWTTADKLERDFRDRKRRNVRDAFWDSGEEARDNINRYKRSKDSKARERGAQLEAAYEKLINKIYEDGGVFEPYRAHGTGDTKDDPWDYYDIDKATFLLLANWMIGSADDVKKGKRKKSAYSIAPNVMQAQESFARYMRDMENKGYGNVRHLYNNAYDFSEKTGSKTGTRFSNIINESFDKYGKNVFWYLRGIYAELQEIRKRGGTGGNYRPYYNRGGGPKGPAGSGDPLRDMESQWDADIKSAAEKAKAEEEAKNAGSEDTDVSMLDREVQDQKDIKKGGAVGKKVNSFLDDLLKAGSLGQKFKVIQSGINELTKKPGLAIAGVIDQADKRIFNLLFGGKEGQEIVDKDGNRVKGFLDYMILKTRETFDKMNDWLDENILNPLKEKLGVKSFGELFKRMADRLGLTKAAGFVKDKVKQWARPTVDRIKAKMGWGWDQVKGSVGRTYGAAWNKAKANFAQSGPTSNVRTSNEDYITVMEWLRNGEITDAEARELLDAQNFVGPMAHGGLVTRRGLAVISPGERVVPVGGRVTQRNNLIEEKAFARRFGLPSGLSFFAGGNTTGGISDEELKNAKETVQKVTSEVMGDTKHKGIANVIASSLLGGGFSLLTGLIGGPLLGAAAGAAFGITQNSGTVQRMLFGDEIIDKDGNPTGERTGGIISADLQRKFKKYFPSMKDFGIAGGLLGLFTPLGLVGGIMAGSALGFAKENDSFQEWIFGKKNDQGERDGGLIHKEFRDKLKKAAPRMLIGAAGGALLGPFGLLGNAVLGSALGFSTTTNAFQEFVFGKDDGHGKKKGGIIPAIQRGIIKPLLATGKRFVEESKKFFDKKIKKPVEEAVPAIIQMVKNGITGIGDHVKDFLANMFERTIGRPLSDFLEHTIFDNVRKWMGRLLKAPLALAKGIISAPFSALGFVGNNIRSSQIAKGTAGDMTAQQRLDWRNKHRFRMFGKEVVGHDAFKSLDETMVKLQGQEGLDKMKELRTQVNLYLNTKRELGKQAAEMVKQAGEIVSEYFNGTMCVDDPTISVYTRVGSRPIKRIHEAISEGNLRKVRSVVATFVEKGYMTGAQEADFISRISQIVSNIADLIQRKKDTKREQDKAMGKLSRFSGGTLRSTKNIRRFSRLLDKEIDAREADEAKAKAAGEAAAATPEAKIINRTDTIISVLRNINAYIAMQAGDTDVGEILGDVTPSKGLKKLMQSKGIDTDDTPKATDDTITGDRREAIERVNNGLHTVETEDGEQGLMDSRGNVLPTQSGGIIKRWKARRQQEREDQRTFREKLNDSLFGKAVGGLTSLLGKAKNGIFGLLGDALSTMSPAFNVLKWAFLGTTAVAAIGHGSGWLEEKVYPFLTNKVFPWLIGTKDDQSGVLIGGLRGLIFGNKTGPDGTYEGGIASELANKFTSWWETSSIGNFFRNVWDTWKEDGIIGFVKPVLNWYAEGGKKFYENIITPLVSVFVQHIPDLAGAIVTGIIDGLKKLFFGGDQDEEETGLMKQNSDGTYTTTYKVNTPEGTTYSAKTSSKPSVFKNTSSNAFATTATGEKLWVDGEGNTAVKRGNTFVYDDGTVSTDASQFTLVKNNAYSSKSSESTILGNLVSGAKNSFLTALTGLRGAVDKIPTASTSGILKNAGKGLKGIVTLNPLGAAYNLGSAGVKTGYNIGVVTGKTAANAGATLREKLLNLIGKGKTSQATSAANAAAAAVGAVEDLNGGIDVDSILNWNTAQDAAETATSAATKSTGILGKIGNTLKSIGAGAKEKLAGTKAGTLLDKASGAISKVTSGAKNLLSGAKNKVAGALGSIKEGAKNLLSNASSKISSAVNSVTNGALDKVKKKVLDFFDSLAKNETVMKYVKKVAKALGTTVDETVVGKALKTLGEKIIAKFGQNATTSVLKSIINAIGSIPIVGLALAIGYFYTGWTDAYDILGVSKDLDLPIHYQFLAGLVNAIKNALPGAGIILSFVPTSTIMDLIVDHVFPLLGWDDGTLEELRDQSQKLLDEANADAEEGEEYTSMEEYNEDKHPTIVQKISKTISNVFSGIGNFITGKKNDSGSSRNKSSASKLTKLNMEMQSRSGRRRLRGFGHLYQGDPRLENVKFGNSTLGKAGCAPVAAANMMNGNLAYATKMAERYQTSDGGVTPDYFANTLGGYQTDSKKSMLRAIKNGQQTVLLGNSGREQGTPFGANDHYITAKGMDRRGNIIVEDPDLPGGSYRYPASRVMRDTTTGVITGMRRGQSRRRGMRRRYGFERTGGDVQAQQVSKLAVKGYNITRQFEGNYGSINKDDNGALSIGRIQWHGVRAFDLVQEIISAVGASTSMSLLGNKIYSEVVNGTRNDWKHRTVNDTEAKQISALISTDIGKKIQDNRACIDYDGYLKAGKNKGLADENALCYYGDLCNQGGSGGANRVLTAAISMAGGSASMVTLDIIHKAALADSVFAKYSARREKCYNALKNSTLVGTTGLTTTDAIPLADDATGATYFSSATTTGDTAGLAETVVGAVFGEDVLNLLKGIQSGFSTTDTDTYSTTGGSVTGTYTGHNKSLPNSGALPTVGSATPEGVVAQMKSITENGIRYSLKGGYQNPDIVQSDGKRYASCASTVAWAYDRAVGYKPGGSGYASSTTQSKDSNFTTIYTNKGNGLVDTNMLQPGDIMYYNWDRTSNNGTMQHTELYAGNGQDISHGGPNQGDPGPLYKQLTDGRKKNLMMVRRYNGFMNASQSGSSRRRGYARAMTSGVSASISDNAKRVISQYGISTSGQTPNYRQGDFSSYSEGAAYNQFLAVIIDLLAAIADNTKGLAEFQNALSNRGISVDSSTLEKAAANARKRAARARNRQLGGYKPNITSATTFTPSDASDLMNSPTGFMVQAMEALATE